MRAIVVLIVLGLLGASADWPATVNGLLRCDACLHTVNALLHGPLLAELNKSATIPGWPSRRSSPQIGAVEGLIDDAVSTACATLVTMSSAAAQMRKPCEDLVESHGDTMIEALVKWHRKPPRAVSELRAVLCARGTKACKPDELGRVPHHGAVFKPSPTGPNQEYMSERPPKVNDGPVFQMVGATLTETMENATNKVREASKS